MRPEHSETETETETIIGSIQLHVKVKQIGMLCYLILGYLK